MVRRHHLERVADGKDDFDRRIGVEHGGKGAFRQQIGGRGFTEQVAWCGAGEQFRVGLGGGDDPKPRRVQAEVVRLLDWGEKDLGVRREIARERGRPTTGSARDHEIGNLHAWWHGHESRLLRIEASARIKIHRHIASDTPPDR